MSLYEFKRNDYFHNVLKTHPRTRFFLYGGQTFYNENIELSGVFAGAANIGHKSVGEVSLYEINVDRKSDQLVYPFITKTGDRQGFGTVSTADFNSNYSFGDQLTGSYPMTSSLHILMHTSSQWCATTTCLPPTRPRIESLKNTMQRYTPIGSHYSYSSSYRDLSSIELSLCSIPSIFYGSAIKKGSVVLRYYLTGNVLAEAKDEKRDGALYQTLPETTALGSGSVIGTVMYNEGFVILTSSLSLTAQYQESYQTGAANPKWTYFGQHQTSNFTSSYTLEFSGTTKTNVLTMLAHAKSGDINYSNNPTFLNFTSSTQMTVTKEKMKNFVERPRSMKNVVSSSYHEHSEPFEETVYISKVGIYDEQKNLIAIAKMASPIKKRLNDEYTFKLKLDI